MDRRLGKIPIRTPLTRRGRPLDRQTGRISLALVCLLASACAHAQSLAAKSPFEPAQAEAARIPPAGGTLQLCGVSETEGRVTLCLVDSLAKRSRWISVGDTVDGITAVSYRAESETALVRVGVSLQTLALKGGTVRTSGAGTPSSKDTKRQEREARMLVSDIVDAGAEQRKANEKAAKKALKTSAKPPEGALP